MCFHRFFFWFPPQISPQGPQLLEALLVGKRKSEKENCKFETSKVEF